MSWVDISYDLERWVELPAADDWGESPWEDEKAWSRSAAYVLLAMNDAGESRKDVRRLSKLFREYRTAYREAGLGRDHYLYFSTPRSEPLAIHLWYGLAEGERGAALRAHARADSTETMREPQTMEFSTDHLGTGLRSLNHVLLEDRTISANLWYAFRSEEHGVDVIASASTGDLNALVTAEADFDAFVRGIRLFADGEGGWAAAEGVDPEQAETD